MAEFVPPQSAEDMIAPATFDVAGKLQPPVYVPQEFAQTTEQKLPEGNLILSIKKLRTEISWNPSVEDLLQKTYGVVRAIGEEVLYEQGNGEATRLLDASRDLTHVRIFESLPEERAEQGIIANHGEHDLVMRLHNPSLLANAKLLKETLEAQGIQLRDPSDALLFIGVNTVAHETGHSLLADVSRFAKGLSTDSGDSTKMIPHFTSRIATRLYLADHPEQGMTGNWETDLRSHEERFAEGFGSMVLDRIIDVLGYGEVMKHAVHSFLLNNASDITKLPLGRHPADFLDDVGSGRDLVDVSKVRGLEVKSNAILGYALPLSSQEMATQLEYLYGKLKMFVEGASELNLDAEPGRWDTLVKHSRSTGENDVARRLMQLRAMAPRPHIASN